MKKIKMNLQEAEEFIASNHEVEELFLFMLSDYRSYLDLVSVVNIVGSRPAGVSDLSLDVLAHSRLMLSIVGDAAYRYCREFGGTFDVRNRLAISYVISNYLIEEYIKK